LHLRSYPLDFAIKLCDLAVLQMESVTPEALMKHQRIVQFVCKLCIQVPIVSGSYMSLFECAIEDFWEDGSKTETEKQRYRETH
jgi:hypothetical protein